MALVTLVSHCVLIRLQFGKIGGLPFAGSLNRHCATVRFKGEETIRRTVARAVFEAEKCVRDDIITTLDL